MILLLSKRWSYYLIKNELLQWKLLSCMALFQSTRWSYSSNLFLAGWHWTTGLGLSCSESRRTWNLSSKSLSKSCFETWLKQKHPNITKPCIIWPFASQNKQWINALIYSSEQCSSIRYELQLDYLKFQVVQGQLVNTSYDGSIILSHMTVRDVYRTS